MHETPNYGGNLAATCRLTGLLLPLSVIWISRFGLVSYFVTLRSFATAIRRGGRISANRRELNGKSKDKHRLDSIVVAVVLLAFIRAYSRFLCRLSFFVADG